MDKYLKNLISLAIFILGIQFLTERIQAQNIITINFDNLPSGTAVEDGRQIDDEYLGMGVIFSSSETNCPTAKKDNDFSISKPNVLSLGNQYAFNGKGMVSAKFVDPQSGKSAVTDTVHLRAPALYFPDTATATLKLKAFDADGNFLTECIRELSLTCSGIFSYTWAITLEVAAVGIDSITFEISNAQNFVVAIDNFSFRQPSVTSVEANLCHDLPKEFVILQNYPNPFNSTTTISYSLSQPDQVRLQIFDVNGKLVKVLVDEQQSPGKYYLKWDGTNSTGQPVASGNYLYQIIAGKKIETRRMVLIK